MFIFKTKQSLLIKVYLNFQKKKFNAYSSDEDDDDDDDKDESLITDDDGSDADSDDCE